MSGWYMSTQKKTGHSAVQKSWYNIVLSRTATVTAIKFLLLGLFRAVAAFINTLPSVGDEARNEDPSLSSWACAR